MNFLNFLASDMNADIDEYIDSFYGTGTRPLPLAIEFFDSTFLPEPRELNNMNQRSVQIVDSATVTKKFIVLGNKTSCSCDNSDYVKFHFEIVGYDPNIMFDKFDFLDSEEEQNNTRNDDNRRSLQRSINFRRNTTHDASCLCRPIEPNRLEIMNKAYEQYVENNNKTAVPTQNPEPADTYPTDEDRRRFIALFTNAQQDYINGR